jgi:hypothetical protein
MLTRERESSRRLHSGFERNLPGYDRTPNVTATNRERRTPRRNRRNPLRATGYRDHSARPRGGVAVNVKRPSLSRLPVDRCSQRERNPRSATTTLFGIDDLAPRRGQADRTNEGTELTAICAKRAPSERNRLTSTSPWPRPGQVRKCSTAVEERAKPLPTSQSPITARLTIDFGCHRTGKSRQPRPTAARSGPRTSPGAAHTGNPLGLDGSFGRSFDPMQSRKLNHHK